MALVHINVTSDSTPTILIQMPVGIPSTAVQITNNHTAAVYIGDKSVAVSGATRGNQIAVNATQQVWLNSGDVVYVISAATSAAGAISVIYSGV